MNHINQNPNNLVEYEVGIVKILGVKLVKEPQLVFYHKRTGAVTVSWSARTSNKIEALRLAIIAPPNDVKKRQVAQKSILNEPDPVKNILAEFADRGIQIKRWWIEKEVNGGPDVI